MATELPTVTGGVESEHPRGAIVDAAFRIDPEPRAVGPSVDERGSGVPGPDPGSRPGSGALGRTPQPLCGRSPGNGMQYLVGTDSVHATAAICDYLGERASARPAERDHSRGEEQSAVGLDASLPLS